MVSQSSIFSFARYWLLFFAGLLVLSEGRLQEGLLLFFSMLLALAYQLFSQKHHHHIRLLKLIAFIPFFLYHSFCSALGVAKLALKPVIRCSPHTYKFRLHGTATSNAIVANIFSLMPGTLSIKIEKNILTLHILDTSLFDPDLLKQTHARIEALFIIKDEVK